MGQSASQRSIQLLRPAAADGIGMFCITEKGRSTYYTFCEIPCDIGGRGFALHRTGIGDLYHVRIGEPDDCSCECLGFLRHGHCRHILGLRALIRNQLL